MTDLPATYEEAMIRRATHLIAVIEGKLTESAGEYIAALLRERVELNAMTSEALVEMIERKLNEYGLEKVVPDDDQLAETYRAFHRSRQLRERFKQMEKKFVPAKPRPLKPRSPKTSAISSSPFSPSIPV